MPNMNLIFCRALLAELMPTVREHTTPAQRKAAWVYKVGDDHWEFHLGDFYWHGSADNAAGARYHGWIAYLGKLGVADCQ